jgi:hypothetical protein
MNRLSKTLLLWTLILCACSPDITSPQTFPEDHPTNTPSPLPLLETNVTTRIPSGPKIIVTVGTPNIGQGPDGNIPVTESSSDTCAFMWAHPKLEELTVVFDTAIKELNSQASAIASAFGEDCVYPDGRKVFFGIETDFYITLPVTDLSDFKSFGNWIAQTMPIVNKLPPDMIEGSNSGFVEYRFSKTENDILIVRVPIQDYEETAQGKTGAELFQVFYKQP